MSEELDYHLEARNQRHFATAFRDDDDVLVPDVLVDSTHVIVTEWVDGTPLSRIITSGTQEERDEAATLYLEFLLRAPNRARLLHADPHPGNFRITDDGRLGVLDFGAVNRLPQGLPTSLGRVLTEALAGDAAALEAVLRQEGFIRKGIDDRPRGAARLPHPARRAAAPRRVHPHPRVAARRGGHVAGPAPPAVPRRAQAQPAPEYLLIHRVWLGGIGVLSQIGGTVPLRELVCAHLPGIDESRLPPSPSLTRALRSPPGGVELALDAAQVRRLHVSQVHTSRPFSTPRVQVIRASAAASSSGGSCRTSRTPDVARVPATRHPAGAGAAVTGLSPRPARPPWPPS